MLARETEYWSDLDVDEIVEPFISQNTNIFAADENVQQTKRSRTGIKIFKLFFHL